MAVIHPETQTPDNAQLVSQSLKGDQKAFRALVDRYSRLIFSHAYQMTRNHELAEEITQEVFVKAYRKLHTFDTARPLKPWLLKIATNTILSQLRKKSEHAVSLDELQESGTWKESDHLTTAQEHENPEHQTIVKITSDTVFSAMQKLDPKYQEALLLRYKEDLTYEDIAASLDIPLNTVRTWIRRGRDLLRQELHQLAQETYS